MNPLRLLDGLLADYASAKTRRLIHSLLLLGSALLTVWLGVGQDWGKAVIALAAMIYAGANKANTVPVDENEGEIVYADLEIVDDNELPIDDLHAE